MNHINSNEDFVILKQKIIEIVRNYDNQDTLSMDTIHNLAIHLAITIIRIQSQNYIPLSNIQLANVVEDETFECAKNICSILEKQFHISFPQEEIAVVCMHITKNHLLDMEIKSGYDLLDKEIFYVLKDSMSDIHKHYAYDFRANDTLLIAIGLHLTPAVERLQNQQMLKNPLTNNIKNEYPLAYSFAKTVNYNIEKQFHATFSEDEIAFIAMHFLNLV